MMKNALIEQIASLCRPKTPNPLEGERSFLIVSTTGLGDTLWGTPAIKALRETYLSASIYLLTSPIGGEIFKYNKQIDQIFTVSDPVLFPLFSLHSRLRSLKITDVILFHTSQRPLLPFVTTLGATRIIGSEGLHKGLDNLLTHSVPRSYVHEIQRRLDLVKEVGAQTQDPSMEIPLSALDEKIADTFLSKYNIPS
ncbi:MAG: hypothetical protein HYZ48_01020, partial [Chlamydiales bacterium]|nr:hypothetical protein [Chlamydiales bacterium]